LDGPAKRKLQPLSCGDVGALVETEKSREHEVGAGAEGGRSGPGYRERC